MDRWTERLSEYLDDTLARGEREALGAHLATCLECRTALEELRRVVDRARGLDDRPPSQDLWSGIASRIKSGTAIVPIDRARTPTRVVRRLSFSVPQALAAGIALVALSSGAVWLMLRTPASRPSAGTRLGGDSIARLVWYHRADAGVDSAVQQLRNTLNENPSLDTSTARILRKNLAIIDSAIAEARRALDQDPGNSYLNHHLADTMRRKADLLRRASALGVRA